MQINNRISTTKNMGAIQRILEYIEIKEISRYKFYKKTGLSNGFLGKGENMGSDKCEIILSCFPDINPSWLLTGKGDMLLKESDPDMVVRITGDNHKGNKTNIVNKFHAKDILLTENKTQNKNDDEINAMKIKIEFLEKIVVEKERYIVLLEQQLNKQ